MTTISYLRVSPGATLPDLAVLSPFRTVIIAEVEVSPDWQSRVSEWLVGAGCLYVMAWGVSSSSWDDSVDMANIERFQFEPIPDDDLVMTTWHHDESLMEVFWFCKNNAFHPTLEFKSTLILHVAPQEREQELLASYAEA